MTLELEKPNDLLEDTEGNIYRLGFSEKNQEGSWKLPKVLGWHILVEQEEILEDSKVGSIILPQTVTDDVKYLTNVGKVKAMGPCCYNNKERYGDTPWCKVGDYVVWGRHQGTHVIFKDKKYVLLLDDSIVLVVDDPKSIDLKEHMLAGF
jgi:co-chaperonin GroES (HSP10)